MKQKLNICVLGIGTELTTGQILNRNAQWISQKMHALGADCPLHVVVPDERPLILEALKNCALHSDVLFITGGLGPTSDDFTREMIAEWTGAQMQWDETSWQHLNERLKQRNIPVKEIQRQQCFFPVGSQILTNRIGTANAFYVNHQGKDIYVLPGPPREIESVWQDWIHKKMEEKCQNIEKKMTRSWDTLGLGESQVAEMVEEVLQGCPLERAYRVHLPYVEFKLLFTSSQKQDAEKWFVKIDETLKETTLVKNGQDVASMLIEKLKLFKRVSIYDQIDGGFLIKRLSADIKTLLKECQLLLSNGPSATESQDLILTLSKKDSHRALAQISYLGIQNQIEILSPYSAASMLERANQYYAEKAMMFFYEEIIRAKTIAN